MYLYTALFFSWQIQSVFASSRLRQEYHVRTRSHLARLARRAGAFEVGGEARRPNQPVVYGGASGGRQPVDQQHNAGSDHGSSQPGSLFDLTQQSHGNDVEIGSTEYWSEMALSNWQETDYEPTYDFTGFSDMIVIPHKEQPNVPATLEFPPSVRSRTTQPPPRAPKLKGRPIVDSSAEGSSSAKYVTSDRKRARERVNGRNHRARKETYIKSLEDENVENKARIRVLEKEVAKLQGRALSPYISDAANEADRLEVSVTNYQRSLPGNLASGLIVPGGEPEGGSYELVEEDGFQVLSQYLDHSIWGFIGIQYDSSLRSRRRSNPQQNPPNDPAAEFNFYADVYTQLRSNVSELLFPYFSNILSHTNSSLIYEMLRSVHSDLVAAGPWTIGPYSNGADCFDWIEEQLFGNITNSTLQNDTVVGVLVNDDMLIEIYSDIWGNASQIANQTGYLKQMSTVRKYLNLTNTSLLPDTWKTAQPLPKSLDFDALYGKHNETLSR